MLKLNQLKTVALTAGIAVLCSACANDPLASAPMQLGAQHPAPMQHTTNAQNKPADWVQPRKTLSDKMLAASALERATGRKPHPTRFRDVD
ncbi:MAG: hypothetical protein ACRBCJ_07050 [Hyphomicrobiaceae bacterium]